ncbi:MAG: hypothetical protein ACRBB0_01405 [Pelagimonas sp.]|uniref:hypothetical protein n=1 Tax=Pelagimonas sp. TaxID=2073170 RepID=UPI003D6A04A7
MSADIKSRTARNSIFLIREGLKELRYHANQMADDPASIDRVIKESDLLSQTCKKLLNFVEAPEIKKTPRSFEKINMSHLMKVIAALPSGDFCPTCGHPRDTE